MDFVADNYKKKYCITLLIVQNKHINRYLFFDLFQKRVWNVMKDGKSSVVTVIIFPMSIKTGRVRGYVIKYIVYYVHTYLYIYM